MYLQGNLFNGNLPASIVDMASLRVMDLSGNSLRGGFPEGFTNMGNLQVVNLSFNLMGGTIPETLGDMTSLVELRLNTNAVNNNDFFGFEGSIPPSVGFLDNLVRMDLYSNRLTGVLPSELGFLDNLQILDVAFNPELGGNLPTELENIVSFRQLHIAGTAIDGVVPNGLCALDLFIEIECQPDSPELTCSCCTCLEE